MAFDYSVLSVLQAPGKRVTKRRESGEVYGLRLQAGGAVPALVLEANIAEGFMAGGTALWIFGPPQHGEVLDQDLFDRSDPITPPLLVDRSLWSHGVAFRWGAIPASHPYRQHRVLYRHPLGHRQVLDSNGNPVQLVRRSDVIGEYTHTLLWGVDIAVRDGLAELRGPVADRG